MKTKLELTSIVSLDEITYQLQESLSTKELVEFVLQVGDKLTDSEEFYNLLSKKINKILI